MDASEFHAPEAEDLRWTSATHSRMKKRNDEADKSMKQLQMKDPEIAGGVVHKLPADLRKALAADREALDAWHSLTPLARNEWICWTTSVKKAETREEHIERLCRQLKEGKRRPCCWIGCIHRKDKAVSPSVQYILNQRRRKSLSR